MEELLETLALYPNRLFAFGPTLDYPVISQQAWTVEKLSAFMFQTDDELRMIVLQTKGVTSARVEGTLYNCRDAEIYQLDEEHQLGVQFNRKRMPVYLPQYDDYGNRIITYAYIYVGIAKYWTTRIEFEQGCKFGMPRELVELNRYNDNDPMVNWRYRFLPPPVPPTNHTTPVPERIRKHVKKRNRAEMRRLNFRHFFDDRI